MIGYKAVSLPFLLASEEIRQQFCSRISGAWLGDVECYRHPFPTPDRQRTVPHDGREEDQPARRRVDCSDRRHVDSQFGRWLTEHEVAGRDRPAHVLGRHNHIERGTLEASRMNMVRMVTSGSQANGPRARKPDGSMFVSQVRMGRIIGERRQVLLNRRYNGSPRGADWRID